MIRDIEKNVWQQCHVIYYPSQSEVDIVKSILPSVNVKKLTPYFFEEVSRATLTKRDRTALLFVAGFGHPPNVDAAKWFVNEILPLILVHQPNVSLTLVGSNPTSEVLSLASPNVRVTGYVTDEQLRDFYQISGIAVVPLRFGAGVKSKVVEAMHHGLPLVTTSVGIQGMVGLEEIVHLGATAAEIADRILFLLKNTEAWEKSSSLGSDYVGKHFSVSAIKNTLAYDFLEISVE